MFQGKSYAGDQSAGEEEHPTSKQVSSYLPCMLKIILIVKIISIGTGRFEQTVQTQIRLFLRSSLIGFTLFAFQSTYFRGNAELLKQNCSIIRELQLLVWVSQYLELLWKILCTCAQAGKLLHHCFTSMVNI